MEWQACLGVLLSGQVGMRDSQAEPLPGEEGRGWVSEHPSRLGMRASPLAQKGSLHHPGGP